VALEEEAVVGQEEEEEEAIPEEVVVVGLVTPFPLPVEEVVHTIQAPIKITNPV
jgi:hypothetical protein